MNIGTDASLGHPGLPQGTYGKVSGPVLRGWPRLVMFRRLMGFVVLLSAFSFSFFASINTFDAFDTFDAFVSTAHAQAPNIAELKLIRDLHTRQQEDDPAGIETAAEAYLAQFPAGRYGDEVLLALAKAQSGGNKPKVALASYERLISEYPDSPFVEQALTQSLPLLRAEGEQERAYARVDELSQRFPNSIQRNQALLWKSQVQYENGAFGDVLTTLQEVESPAALSEVDQATYYRLQTLALVSQGEAAWTPLNRYLKRKDTPAHKADVLLRVAAIARKAKREEEALGYYQQVVEDFPVKEHINEAIFWRAELYNRTRIRGASPELQETRRDTAIGFYGSYLKLAQGPHRAAAYQGRAGLYRQAGETRLALADYGEAIRIDPELQSNLGVITAQVDLYKKTEQPEQAATLLKEAYQNKALSSDQRTGFQIRLAALHYEARACGEVEALLNPMPIVADPAQRPQALFLRGFCRYARGDWEKASFDLEGLVNHPDYQAQVIMPLLEAYEKSGQNSRLVNLGEELLQAGRVVPDENLLHRMAEGYDRMGEAALMVSAYQRLEKLNPQAVLAPATQLRLGKAKERLNLPQEARDHYLIIAGSPPNEGDLPTTAYMTALERLQTLMGEESQFAALERLNQENLKAVTDPPSLKQIEDWQRALLIKWGATALKRGNPKLALEKLETAYALNSTGDPSSDSAGNRAGDQSKQNEVAALLITALIVNGEGARGFQLYGEVSASLAEGEPRHALMRALLKALAHHEKAVLHPDNRAQTIGIYREAMESLPKSQKEPRRQAALMLDRLYTEEGNFPALAALVKTLLKDGQDEGARKDLRRYQGRIYKNWGAKLAQDGNHQEALFQFGRGLERLEAGEWRLRYEIVVEISKIQLQQKAYTDLVLLNEDVLGGIKDEDLKARIRHFLGQVHLEWAKEADQAGNLKSSRIRYYRALDYLPGEDWQRRLAATNGLAATLVRLERPAEGAALYETMIPQLPDEKERQKFSLYLGRLYEKDVKDLGKAREWLTRADRGDTNPLSLEAGYLLADQQMNQGKKKAALLGLEAMADRGLNGSAWEVPIHYRIAVIHHQGNKLRKALSHYRVVAAVKSKEMLKLYPRSIKLSREQIKEIEAFLNISGGENKISVPKVNSN